MAYEYGNREQITFSPDSIEKYVLEDDPVRAYDAFIDALGANSLGLSIEPDKTGNSTYDPVSMLKILIYGYSYGWRSSRKLEHALHHNLSFIWLSGGLKPDYKTIANFRKNNKQVLKNVLKRCVRMCIRLDLIEGNVLFFDGSKIRANAGNSQTKNKETLEKLLKHTGQRIDHLLENCQQVDDQEQDSFIKMNKELQSKERLHKKISGLIEEMKEETTINGTDPESKIMKGRQGSHSSYNGQISVDDLHGLIVSVDTVNDVIDKNQLDSQVEQAEENIDKPCQTICADAGYSSVDALKPLVDSERTVIVPNNKQAQKEPEAPGLFDKEKFKYDPHNDSYTCPEGKTLYRSSQAKGSNKITYRMTNYRDCLSCAYYGKCTSAKKGRTIYRLVNEATQQQLVETYEKDTSKQIYKRRKMKVELPFGHIKRNLGVGSFLLRGLAGINAELNLLASCFNMARLISLLGGVKPMIQKLGQING